VKGALLLFVIAAAACGRTGTIELLLATGGGGAVAGGRSGGGSSGGGVAGGVTGGGGGVLAGGVAGGGVAGGGVAGGVAGGGTSGGGSAGGVPGPCPERMQSLQQARSAMVGTWSGTWTARYEPQPQAVRIIFDGTGRYFGRNAGLSTNYPAFAYGTEFDRPEQKYLLDAIKANGDAAGIINIAWDNGTSTEGTLDSVRFCDSDQRLDFVFSPAWLSGRIPHTYRLTRQ